MKWSPPTDRPQRRYCAHAASLLGVNCVCLFSSALMSCGRTALRSGINPIPRTYRSVMLLWLDACGGCILIVLNLNLTWVKVCVICTESKNDTFKEQKQSYHLISTFLVWSPLIVLCFKSPNMLSVQVARCHEKKQRRTVSICGDLLNWETTCYLLLAQMAVIPELCECLNVWPFWTTRTNSTAFPGWAGRVWFHSFNFFFIRRWATAQRVLPSCVCPVVQ